MNAADVLVVGAGATGAAVSWRLGAAGLRVVCLEQGGWMDPSRYPSTRPDWERARLGPFHVSPNVRRGAADYPINDADSPIAIANFNAVGGATVLYSGHFPRFHPSDFRVYSNDGVADDWPLDYAALEPYFAENDRIMGVAGLGGDPAYPPIENLLPPVPLGRLGETLGRGFNRLGWHWWPSYSAIATRPHGGRAACVNLGPCNTGCPQGAKASVDVTYWPRAIRAGVELRTGCRVRELVVGPDGRVTGAAYYDTEGREQFAAASIVVLACNGVGTPRLLLNSRSPAFPDGLANRSGQVGRNLMLHPLGYIEGLFEEPLDAQLGPQGCCILSQQFYESDPSRGFVRGYTMQVLRGSGPAEQAAAGVLRRDIPLGPGHHEAFSRRFGHTATMTVILEDLPDGQNCVTLDPELADAHGIPAPRIRYRLSENSRRMLAHGLSRGRELMTAAGAVRTAAFGPVRHSGWHLMGTVRMGSDPARSVVDRGGRAHDVPNLYVADSSVFVTSGAVNPVSTMQAIALYIADGIVRAKSSGPTA